MVSSGNDEDDQKIKPDASNKTEAGGGGGFGEAGGMRNVTALGLVSFFTDFSTEMVLGVLPFFIVSTLGTPRALLGVIEGSAELTSYAFRMVSGSLSDKAGKRKAFIIAGYGLSTVTKPFFAASTSWLEAFVVRFIDRVGKGIRTAPRDALIADSVSESRVGRAFGIHRTIDQLGAIVGPIASFWAIAGGGYQRNLSPIADTWCHSSSYFDIICKRSSGGKEVCFYENDYVLKYSPCNKRQQALRSPSNYFRYLWYWSF